MDTQQIAVVEVKGVLGVRVVGTEIFIPFTPEQLSRIVDSMYVLWKSSNPPKPSLDPVAPPPSPSPMPAPTPKIDWNEVLKKLEKYNEKMYPNTGTYPTLPNHGIYPTLPYISPFERRIGDPFQDGKYVLSGVTLVTNPDIKMGELRSVGNKTYAPR